MSGYGLMFVPLSWAFGKWTKEDKVIWSFGPFRAFRCDNLGPWKA